MDGSQGWSQRPAVSKNAWRRKMRRAERMRLELLPEDLPEGSSRLAKKHDER
jgi:hypothetical protein